MVTFVCEALTKIIIASLLIKNNFRRRIMKKINLMLRIGISVLLIVALVIFIIKGISILTYSLFIAAIALGFIYQLINNNSKK